ncbi:late cornified envelope-like proline-rich protein 1 isoform X3 [Myiozetetes cayanensis]|uniref:late cornified envelope-like proline-rich protein 1 isoform X3 n=1 Tax=Myiozetetes cayanensis TaxID=478635 RepID=UPI0021608855|nr:late cornified envelope-like proline-rich protein 1 isoform X3 [Myiozetetes cayanensis]
MPPGVPRCARIQSSRSTSSDRFIFLVMVEKMNVPRCAQVCSQCPQVCPGVPRCVPNAPRCAQVCPGVSPMPPGVPGSNPPGPPPRTGSFSR